MKDKYDLDFFDDLIDHSYDNEPDYQKRFVLIFKEIIRLNGMKDEIVQFYINNEDRLEKNKEKIKKIFLDKSDKLYLESLAN